MLQDFDLDRFVEAQESSAAGYDTALREMKAGEKRSHWIWYIFPQIAGLGHSGNSEFFGITCLEEAKAYLENPILGPRLREITEAVLSHAEDRLAIELMGWEIDAMKLKSSMTLFDQVSPGDIFADVLEAFFDSARCGRTLRMLRDIN